MIQVYFKNTPKTGATPFTYAVVCVMKTRFRRLR